MEEIITSLGSIKIIIIIIIIITWVSLGRKSRERFVFPLFGWLEERRKQGIWHPSGSQTNSFFFFSFLHLQPNTVLVEEKVMRGRKWAGFFETFETLSNHVQLLYHPQSPSWRWKKQRRTAMIAKDELFVYKGWGGLKKAKKERISKIYSLSGRARVLCRGYAWLVYF